MSLHRAWHIRRSVFIPATFLLVLGACGFPEGDIYSEASAPVRYRGTFVVTAQASPSELKPGEAVTVALAVTSSSSVTVDIVLTVKRPDGAVTHSASIPNQFLSANTARSFQEPIPSESTDSQGSYVVGVMLIRTGSTRTLYSNPALSQFTVVAPTDVPPAPACATCAAGTPSRRVGYWWSDIEAVPLGVAQSGNATSTALKKEWTWFGQPGQEDLYGFPEIVSAAQQGVPSPPAGDHVIKLLHAKGDPAVHHKLYKTFTGANWPSGVELGDGPPPADASGRYIAFMYVPSSRFTMTSHGWAIMFMFKETIITTAGFQQDPTWWVGVDSFGGPYQYTLNFTQGNRVSKKYDFKSYLDRWVKWEFRVYQGNRIEWYLDDQLMDTGYQNEQTVGPICQVGGTYRGATITECRGWVFGAGNYTSNQSFSGPSGNEPDYNYIDTLVYVDLSTVQPLP